MMGKYIVADIKGTNGKPQEIKLESFNTMTEVNGYINRAGGYIKDYFHIRTLIMGNERLVENGMFTEYEIR